MVRRILLVAILTMGSATAFAQQQPSATISELIQRLDSRSYRVRQQTARDILHYRAAALPHLKKAVASRKSLELMRRAKVLLEALAIYEPGGEVVNGVKVCLMQPSQKSISVGDALSLKTMICNMTDAPIHIWVGNLGEGNRLLNGFAYRQLVKSDSQDRAEKHMRSLVPSFCGTAKDIIITVAPKSAHIVYTPCRVVHDKKETFAIFGPMHSRTHELKKSLRLRVVVQVLPYTQKRLQSRGPMSGTIWQGIAKSNEVVLSVVSSH